MCRWKAGQNGRRKKRGRKSLTWRWIYFNARGLTIQLLEQIAEEADIARKTLYNHFPVKDAIVDEYVRGISKESNQQILETLPNFPDTRSRLLNTLDKVYEQVENNPEIVGIVMVYRLRNMNQGAGYRGGGSQSLIAEIIRLGQEAGEIRQDIPAKLLVKQIDILRSVVVMDWLNDSSSLELRKEIAKLVDLFLDGALIKEGSQ